MPNTEDKRDAIAEESKQPAPATGAPSLIHEAGPHIIEKTLFDKDKKTGPSGGAGART